MANQFQVDKSQEFNQRMTLINEVSSDKYLEQHRRQMEEQNLLRERLTMDKLQRTKDNQTLMVFLKQLIVLIPIISVLVVLNR